MWHVEVAERWQHDATEDERRRNDDRMTSVMIERIRRMTEVMD